MLDVRKMTKKSKKERQKNKKKIKLVPEIKTFENRNIEDRTERII